MPKFNTIRARLTLWNSIVVLALALLSLLLTRQVMVVMFDNQIRELLQEEIVELELAVKQFYPDLDQIENEFARKILSHSRNRWFARLQDSAGNVVWQSERFPELAKASPAASATPFRFQRGPDAIACWHSVSVSRGRDFTIILGEPLDLMARDLATLTRVLLVSAFGVLIVAPLGGYLLARRSMQPVKGIVQAMRRMRPGSSGERLPLRNTGDELDQISTEINSYLDQNARYLASQKEFIANAAHELRSPLTAIQTSAEVCLSKQRSADEYQDQLETVIEQSQELRYLVNQLLELAETDSGLTINKRDFDFSQLLHRSLSVFEGVADERPVTFEIDAAPSLNCQGDPEKLVQVLNNLLDNAIKFSRPGSKILIRAATVQDTIVLQIVNETELAGSLDAERVFDRFYQGSPHRNRSAPQGNGLGLSICKSTIELHGGTIRATAEASGGKAKSGGLAAETGRFEVVVEFPRFSASPPAT